MIQVKDGETVVATYRYDGLTRRIRKLLGPDPENPTATYDYYHNPARQILETRKNGSASPYEQYVWGLRYVHSPVLRWRDENTDGQDIEILYYTNDANLNVTALVEPDGDVVERVVYDPYGKATFYDSDWANPVSTSAYANDVLYTGHRLDTESGLYYAGARYYDPVLGRWSSWDWIVYGDGMSMYEYCRSIPTGRVDPTGRVSFSSVAGSAFNAAAAAAEAVADAVAAAEEAYSGSCTAKTTIYCANVAAGLMLAQFTKWLRRLPVEPDISLNLLTNELVCLPTE